MGTQADQTSSISEIATLVQAGTSATVAVEAALAAAKADTHNAVVAVHEDLALATAAKVDERIAAGENLPLAGVPVLAKDNICVKDQPVGACSRILTGFKPPYNATVIAKLQQAGAVIIGSANMDEFAMGSSNETSLHGPVKNPADPERVPGGSSGGSAAAVAANIVPLALGSDTGGSIRQPASFCGCVGLKPTYGRVSRYGLLAFGSSLDQIGPLTHSVADARLALSVLAGHDEADSTSVDQPVPSALGNSSNDLSGKRIGFIPAHVEQLSDDVRQGLQQVLDRCKDAGAELVECSLPHEQYAVATYYIIATGEAASNLSRYDGIHYGHRSATAVDSLEQVYTLSRGEGFGAEVKRRIMLGTYLLSAGYASKDYKQAMKVRACIKADYDACFGSCDVLLGPTAPSVAFKTGEKTADPLQMYLSDIFTIGANLAGIPAISLPLAKDANGLPIGIHLQAPSFAEERLFDIGEVLSSL